MKPDMETPCYVIGDKGVSYEDGWCWGRTEVLGPAGSDAESRALIYAHIRQAPEERNGIRLYYLSDHGNLHRARAIRLRGGVQ
jgi:hypothetical protein